MADHGFKGTTFAFGGTTQGNITDASFSDEGGEVAVTDAADEMQKYLNGPGEKTFSLTVTGGSTIAKGTTGTCAITWNDGTTSGNTTDVFLCTGNSASGSVGGKKQTALTFKPFGG